MTSRQPSSPLIRQLSEAYAAHRRALGLRTSLRAGAAGAVVIAAALIVGAAWASGETAAWVRLGLVVAAVVVISLRAAAAYRAAAPKYEEFLERKEWSGKIALDDTDDEWLSAMIMHYGEERGRTLLRDLVSALKPVLVDGHLALARSVGAGEYWLALNNYASLTVNVRLSGAPIDFWALDPVALFFGSVGISAQAPHPKAALLGANFLLSREAQQFLTKRGRMPTRPDVPVNPADITDRLKDRTIIATIFAGEEQKKWQGLFKDIFKPK